VSYGLNDTAAYNDKPGNRREERNGESFIAELEKAGIPLRTYLEEGMGHGFCSGPHLDASTRDIDHFLQECGLLAPPKTQQPDTITGAARGRHVQAALAGKLKRVAPKILEFPTKE
jgi:hypothetical protein